MQLCPLGVFAQHPQARDGHHLLAADIELAGHHELLGRLELELLGEHAANLGRLLARALREERLLVGRDLLDALEQL